jgi:hypothetical protein
MSIDKNFIWRGPPVNGDLASRYGCRWHYSVMERRVKNDAAAAAKNATQLEQMSASFALVLDASQLLALNAAVQVSKRLAADLKRLRPWAAGYAAFSAQKERREYEERLDASAARLWANDVEALAEAVDLVAFYANGVEGEEVDEFIIKQKQVKYRSVYRQSSSSNEALSQLPKYLASHSVLQVRRCAVAILDAMGHGEGWNGTWFVGRNDYEAWRKARARSRAVAAAALATVRE